MTAEVLPCVEQETGPNPTAAVIWLHGLGADGNDFVPIVGEMRLPASLPIRFVFPHAPVRPVTLNNGFRMRAWYDLSAGDITNRADVDGVRESQAHIEALIAREKARGIEARRIVIAGFSQGGVIALHTGVRHAERLAGIVALSTYVVLPEKLAEEGSAGQSRRADLHGARNVRSDGSPAMGRSRAAGAHRGGLSRRVAHLPDAALGRVGRDRGGERVPGARARLAGRAPTLTSFAAPSGRAARRSG